MGRFGHHVIDADGHGGEPPQWWKRMPAHLAEQTEAFVAKVRSRYGDIPTSQVGEGMRPGAGHVQWDASAMRPGMYDPAPRLDDMDLEGIDMAVLFPPGAGEEWALRDPQFAIALCRTLNDARAEYCAHAPQRLKAVAKLPMMEPQAAAEELHRAVTTLGMVGMVTPQHVLERNLDDPAFDVVWKAAQDLDVPVCIHGGGQAPDQVPWAIERFDTRLMVHAVSHPFGQMMAVMCFTAGGVLTRFPRLRAGFMEGGVGWLPFWLERLDEHWELMRDQAQCEVAPSELILGGRCFISGEPDEKLVAYLSSNVSDRLVCYASDYHHWDCQFPDSVRIVVERDDLSAAQKQRILCDNPAALYGFAVPAVV